MSEQPSGPPVGNPDPDPEDHPDLSSGDAIIQKFFTLEGSNRLVPRDDVDLGGIDTVQIAFATSGSDAFPLAESFIPSDGSGMDLTAFTQCRLSIEVFTIGTGDEQVQMSYTLGGGIFTEYGDPLTLSAPGLYRTEWFDIPDEARGLVKPWVTVWGGDGATGTRSFSVAEFRH